MQWHLNYAGKIKKLSMMKDGKSTIRYIVDENDTELEVKID